jgi:diguanylate cyclase (GGDEF)-like protein
MDPIALTPALNGYASLSSSLLAALLLALLAQGQERLRSDRWVASLGWWAALGLAGGSGLWALHVVSLSGLVLPWEPHFDPLLLTVAWGLSVLGATAWLALARVKWPHLGIRVAAMALGLALWWQGVGALAQYSLTTPPDHTGIGPAVQFGATVVGAALGLWLGLWPGARALGSTELRWWLGALPFGVLSGAALEHATQALRFLARPQGVPDGGADANVVWLLSGAASLLLLLGQFGLFSDARSRHRQASLSASLDVAHARLRAQALSDPLTRLPNRALFEERLSQQLDPIHPQDPESLAVLFVDLDGFKPVNDSFGHAAGDAVLAEIGERLRQVIPAEGDELVARVGGDEFLLLLNLRRDPERAVRMAQVVLKSIGRPCRLPNGVEVNLSCSIGIVTYPAHGPGSKLIANADAAMYAAKRAGGSSFALFAPSMDQDARLQLELQTDLRAAIDRHELELYYQPKVHALSGQITGAEALVRWNHPTRGMISPAVFIPVAERFGLISPLGYWVIEEACRQVRDWLDQGLRMRVAVNLSMQQLRQDDLVPRIRAALEGHRIDPSLLTFEITESVAMEDNTMRAFSALAGVGVSLSIDDFGTAYSNFAALRKLPAKQLKIDRSLFTDIHESGDALAVVDAMIKMAHALGLKVVAEGVETEQQRDLLLALHCDEFQGYLFGRPMTAHMLSLWALGEGETHPVEFRPSLYEPIIPS